MKGHFLPNGDIQLDDGTTILKPVLGYPEFNIPGTDSMPITFQAKIQPLDKEALLNLGESNG